MRESTLRGIFDLFDEHCHFCGDKIEFSKHSGKCCVTGCASVA